ncbi:hypothetical protein OSTOST_15138 [Ostertagia ostertagi]
MLFGFAYLFFIFSFVIYDGIHDAVDAIWVVGIRGKIWVRDLVIPFRGSGIAASSLRPASPFVLSASVNRQTAKIRTQVVPHLLQGVIVIASTEKRFKKCVRKAVNCVTAEILLLEMFAKQLATSATVLDTGIIPTTFVLEPADFVIGPSRLLTST